MDKQWTIPDNSNTQIIELKLQFDLALCTSQPKLPQIYRTGYSGVCAILCVLLQFNMRTVQIVHATFENNSYRE